MNHILLIDDDTELTTTYKAALEGRAFSVTVANSGDEGWKRLNESTPDLVVLDCMLEEFTSGFEIAHDIGLKFPDLPVLFLTNVSQHMSADWKYGPEDKDWLPINKFLEKPIAADRLVAEIQRLLARKDAR